MLNTSSSAFELRRAAIKVQYRRSLRESALELDALTLEPGSSEDRAATYFLAHRLAGAAPQFGYLKIGSAAAQLADASGETVDEAWSDIVIAARRVTVAIEAAVGSRT